MNVNSKNPPIIIFHGEKDNVVPCCQGKEFYELLKAAGVTTEAFPKAVMAWACTARKTCRKWYASSTKLKTANNGESQEENTGRIIFLATP